MIPPRFHNVSYENDFSPVTRALIDVEIKNRNGLYIYGDSGVGKTHLACALAKDLLEKGFKVSFFEVAKLLELMRRGYDKGDEEENGDIFWELMTLKNGFIFLDDIGAEKLTDWARERLYLIINEKYNDLTPIIFTSNCDIEILSARAGDRITSRIVGTTEPIRLSGADRRYTK